MRTLPTIAAVVLASLAGSATLRALGLSSPTRMERHQQRVVEVSFDLLPTAMRFHAPDDPCMITETGRLALYPPCRFVRIDVQKDCVTGRKEVPNPTRVFYQQGNLVLQKLDEIPPGVVPAGWHGGTGEKA